MAAVEGYESRSAGPMPASIDSCGCPRGSLGFTVPITARFSDTAHGIFDVTAIFVFLFLFVLLFFCFGEKSRTFITPNLLGAPGLRIWHTESFRIPHCPLATRAPGSREIPRSMRKNVDGLGGRRDCDTNYVSGRILDRNDPFDARI